MFESTNLNRRKILEFVKKMKKSWVKKCLRRTCAFLQHSKNSSKSNLTKNVAKNVAKNFKSNIFIIQQFFFLSNRILLQTFFCIVFFFSHGYIEDLLFQTFATFKNNFGFDFISGLQNKKTNFFFLQKCKFAFEISEQACDWISEMTKVHSLKKNIKTKNIFSLDLKSPKTFLY